jgi:hypothetical protein
MSGRGAGFCAGINAAGYQTAGGGFGRGCGRGFGLRNRFISPVQPDDELSELKQQMARIEQQLGEIQNKP